MSISENKGEGRKESHLNCAAFDFKIARNESLVDLLLLLFAKGPPPPTPALKENLDRGELSKKLQDLFGARRIELSSTTLTASKRADYPTD